MDRYRPSQEEAQEAVRAARRPLPPIRLYSPRTGTVTPLGGIVSENAALLPNQLGVGYTSMQPEAIMPSNGTNGHKPARPEAAPVRTLV